ncbi:transglutaminaseTgpA domain-containing protein [Thermomonas sp.]|uniref:transglutaminase family protein n=1 Tax=Thermomonas sp. TaxID=1971895 RepID=UPI0035B2A8FD
MTATAPHMPAASRRHVLAAAAICLLPLLLQLPLALGLGFGASALLVTAAAWRRPLPALLRILLGITAIIAVAATMHGIGRDSACGLLAGMLALKPSETFSLRDGRSLLGFALFAPFATFLLDQGPLSLALALLAVVAVLSALRRLAGDESGGSNRPQASTRPGWQDLGEIVRLLGLGLPLALAAFWLFPRLPTPLWGLPDRAVAKPGLSDTMTPGGWLDLMSDDSPAARVQFFGATPARAEMYWRGPVLWDFDGATWHQLRWDAGADAAEMQPGDVRYDYQLDMEPTEGRDLVALDLPLQAPPGSMFALGHSLRAERSLDNVTRWRLQSAPPSAFQPALPPALRMRALLLPRGFNPRTVAMGRAWRREAGHDADGRADAALVGRALAMIRRDFAYTLDVPLAGRNEVDDFLFERRQGYCEHFSSAFAVLMRAAGIPTRVVTGYAGGYRNPIGDYWVVLNSDAHAWNEVWLPRRGWVRVDPTAAVAPERVFDTLADRRPGRIGAFDGLVGIFDASDWLRRGWNDFVLGFNAQRQQRMLDPLGLAGIGGRGLVLLFALVAGLAMGWMAWWLARGERERDPLLRAWHRLGERYARIGRARDAHEPAQAWADRVAADVPRAGIDLRTLGRRFSAARYARVEPAMVRALVRDLSAHRP